jgi:hypothetical protein
MEVIFRQVNGATTFADEGMRMAILAARLVHLQARAAGDPHRGNPGVIKARAEFVESLKSLAAHWNKGIDSKIKYAGCLAQIVSEKLRSILAEIYCRTDAFSTDCTIFWCLAAAFLIGDHSLRNRSGDLPRLPAQKTL